MPLINVLSSNKDNHEMSLLHSRSFKPLSKKSGATNCDEEYNLREMDIHWSIILVRTKKISFVVFTRFILTWNGFWKQLHTCSLHSFSLRVIRHHTQLRTTSALQEWYRYRSVKLSYLFAFSLFVSKGDFICLRKAMKVKDREVFLSSSLSCPPLHFAKLSIFSANFLRSQPFCLDLQLFPVLVFLFANLKLLLFQRWQQQHLYAQ